MLDKAGWLLGRMAIAVAIAAASASNAPAGAGAAGGEIEDLLRKLPPPEVRGNSSGAPSPGPDTGPATAGPASGGPASGGPAGAGPASAPPATTSDAAPPASGTAADSASGAAPPPAPGDISAGEALPAPKIVWRVDNPFRFFTDPRSMEVHRATWLALAPEERATPILSAERALAKRLEDGWAATMFLKTCWDAATNRHACPDPDAYINPKSHRVIAELEGVTDTAVSCTWLTAPRGGPSARGKAKTAPCSEPQTFSVPYPGGMRLSVEIGGREIAANDIKVRDVLVAGIGDSFASGEGNPDLAVRFSRERAADYGKKDKSPDLVGYPARIGSWSKIGDKEFIDESARWLDTACHRSLYSHQIRAALQLAVEDPHRAVTLVNVACSGAEVTFGLFLRYKGNEWVPNPPELSQISALAEAQCGSKDAPFQDLPEAYHIGGAIPELKGGLVLRKCHRDEARKIDLLLVSIGGNDIGFARLVANAVLGDQSLVKRLGGWFGQVHGNAETKALLDRLDERYKALNRAVHGILHIPWEQSDRVILTAYPPLAVLDDGNSICPDGAAGMEVFRDFSLSQAIAKDSSVLADKLQSVMVRSARTHGWTLADAHRKAFNGRGICAGFTDNAFSLADDLRFPRLVDGLWQPYNPADYKAYDIRQRWFRTPNDAFMTGNFHVSGSIFQKVLKLQSLSWFQVLLASTYGGAFHPTAEGHAAIADAVADKARRILDKYKQ